MKTTELKQRLNAAKRRLRYHSRSSAGASKTRKPAGESRDLARADVQRLSFLLNTTGQPRAENQ